MRWAFLILDHSTGRSGKKSPGHKFTFHNLSTPIPISIPISLTHAYTHTRKQPDTQLFFVSPFTYNLHTSLFAKHLVYGFFQIHL